MQNSSQPPLYRILAKFDMKGKWAVMANVIACVLLLVGFGVSWFLFPFNSGDLLPSLIKIGGGILIGGAAILLTSVFKLIILKASGSGKIKVHLGMVCDVYTTFPVKRTAYFLSDFLGAIVLLLPLLLWCIFAWNAMSFWALLLYVINLLPMIPLFRFELSQPKDSFLQFDQGNLMALIPMDPSEATDSENGTATGR